MHPWFSDFKEISHARKEAMTKKQNSFVWNTMIEPNSPKIQEEIEKYSKN